MKCVNRLNLDDQKTTAMDSEKTINEQIINFTEFKTTLKFL